VGVVPIVQMISENSKLALDAFPLLSKTMMKFLMTSHQDNFQLSTIGRH
jgi:hypothetical protein